ncbi:MAG: alpha/beta hydrolase [Leptonema sp. (in: bacteria)]
MKFPFPLLISFLMLSILTLCRTTIRIEEELNNRIMDPMIDSKEIPVYIITNRKAENTTQDCSNNYFKNQPETLRWLICFVNVPKNHSIGALDTAKNESLDKDTYYFAKNFTELEEKNFYDTIVREKEILVFVHGFNVEFEEALFRAAQIKYDLKFQGIVVLFTWPAGSEKNGLFSNLLINETYRTNQKNAKNTIPHFKEFLRKLIEKKSKNTKLYLIVHSMGHQIVIPSLVELSAFLENRKFEELIFNAPDYSIPQWKTEEKLIKKTAKRITMYCSPKDNALLASEKVNGEKRLGQCYKTEGIDVINVNRIDSPILGIGGLGHGYYSKKDILTDLYQLFLGMDAKKRLFIIKSNQSTEDYILRD